MAEMTKRKDSQATVLAGCKRGQWTRRRHPVRLFSRMAMAVALALAVASHLHAQRSGPSEYEVKAAYLYNFGKFVEWPAKGAAEGDTFTICVLGEDSFAATLDRTVRAETINGKKAVVKPIGKSQDPLGCRILFINSSEESRLKQILTTLDRASVLTVSDMPEFTRRGGMIQFIVEANRVRFEVNLTNAEHAGLTLSSQLLRVAISVRRNSQPGA